MKGLKTMNNYEWVKELGLEIDEGKRSTAKAIHIKNSDGLYIFAENNWYRHSDGKKGFPVDLVMEVLNCSKSYALEFLSQHLPDQYIPPPKAREKAGFKIPNQVPPSVARLYLIHKRGIDYEIVDDLIKQGIISEDAIYHNVMFIGRDINGIAHSCGLRGTGMKQFRGEVSGGNKSYSFAMIGQSHKLRIFESPIDAMSHATFSKLLGINWGLDHRLSTNGCGYMSVKRYLTEHRDILNVIISFDNDEPGRKGAESVKNNILSDFSERKLNIGIIYPHLKDWNEDLVAFRAEEKNGVSAISFLARYYPQLSRYE